MRVLPAGDCGLLLEVDDLAQVLALAGRLRARPLPGVVDLVPAARTVLLVLDPSATTPAAAAAAVASLPVDVPGAQGSRAEEPETVVVPVVYDGEDLADVADLTGLSPEEVVAAHVGQTWRVAFGGFAPGFGYLLGQDDRLHVPRRTESRTRVPAGAVGLAGEYSGIYPRTSPGGWQLIGRTDADLWDLDRDPPALLSPGVRVRFVQVTP